VIVGATFPLAEAASARQAVEGGKVIGKTVLLLE
jgi:NADPH:quinone reductase-like Zn-dependent oxidoreductase